MSLVVFDILYILSSIYCSCVLVKPSLSDSSSRPKPTHLPESPQTKRLTTVFLSFKFSFGSN